uniref:Structural maintenance of chromosomes protein 6 n=1 Tax=Callorhinchus milii TaxID=7868 RepID=A0A4W3I2F4_CALMI
ALLSSTSANISPQNPPQPWSMYNLFFLFQNEGEVGIIESISLKNFMCHACLGPFKFGPNVNFVVGNNGSGKSAVLAALIVGLGGKATATNRGYSIKGFVKNGQNSADIAITLRNRGPDAFKADIYGEAIIVEQHISREGIRQYRLKSKTGHLVSTKKEELNTILDQFNIQVDNPVSILTQEMSKHFLQSKSEADKYKFFMKATQLEQMREDYAHIMRTKALTNEKIGKQDEVSTSVKVSEEEEKFKAVQDRLQKITEETQVLGPQRTALKEDVQSKNKAYKETEVGLINNLNRCMKCYIFSQADLRERQERINSQQEQLKVLKDQEATTLQQTDQFQHAISKSRDELYQLRREEQDVKNVCESRKRRLKELKASRTDRLERFGENVPSLLNAIEEAHKGGRFRKKPVGPLGACFRLKYPEFGLAVESCLKGLLLSFCCDNFRDEQVLQSLMSRNFRTGRRPQINVCEFQNDVYDVRGKGVYHPDFPTILDAIEIDNAVVANCLIDMRGIERVLLIKDNSTARKVMQQQKAPKNCREAFTEAGDQVFTNRYYSSEMDRARYLGSDVETEIRQLEIEINNKVAQLSHFQQRLQSIEEEIRLNEVQLKKKQIQRRQIQVRSLKKALHLILEEEAQDIWRRIESGKGKLEKAKEDMDVHRKILDEAEQNYKEIKEKISLIAEEADPIKEELSSIDTEIVKDKHLWRHYENKKKEHLYGIDKLKEDLTTKEKVLEENTSKASQICKERLEVTKTPKSIDLEINHLRERINTEQKLHGNREEIIRQYFEVLETYKRVKGQIKSLKKFMRLLTKIMEGRHRAYKIFRRYISLRCKYYFNTMLSQRGYHGKMNFDHKNETLSIAVQPGEGDKAALSDMRSLSGGERSFSTVCFILSLWDTMESPFRCLDEFDVYMDMVNRRISMDMMLKVANSQRYRQFIFLTPQSMSSLPSSSLIRILRMHDPERGQTTLPFRPRDQAEDSDD